MNWQEYLLEDIANCELGKMLDKNKNKGEYEFYLSNVDVRWGYFEIDDLKKMRFESREFERYSLKAGDIIMCEGGEAGRCAVWQERTPKMMYQKALHRIRTIKGVESKFLYYTFLNMGNQNEFERYYTGSTIKHLPLQILKKIPIKIAPLPTQKRIASILSAYDDLIENNLKRIKLLEETAQNIYKEWFVNFRFPNHQNTPINQETGLPEGWEMKSLNNFDCIYQFKEKVKPFIGEKEYLATANVEGINISERGEYFTFDNRPSRAQYLAPKESVWFARMSKTYKVLLFTKSSNSNILLSSGFVGFVPKNSQYLPYLFCLINNKIFFETKDLFCTGSTQVSLNNESISKLIYLEPTKEIIGEFGNKMYPLIVQINKFFELNQKLKEARDILLPRLMNRTIEV